MRRALLSLGCATLVLGLAVPSAMAGDVCVPAKAKVVADTGRAVVYAAGRNYRDIYACLRSRPRPVYLTDNRPDSFWDAKIAGRFAAVSVNQCNSQGCAPVRVDIYDLRRARRVAHNAFDGSGHLDEIATLVLRATGVAAFTGISHAFGLGWVWVARPHQRRQLIDHGEGVEPYSLRKDDTVITWQHGADSRSTPLE
jgi:hypothetical protein